MEGDPLGRLVQEKLTRFQPPSGMEERIRRRLREEAGGKIRDAGRQSPIGFWFAAVGGLAAALVVGFLFGEHTAEGTAFARELVSDQARAEQGSPLIEVASTDRHTVKPWLSSHLDFSPPVADLTADGFPLDGGRRERISGKAAAALVYRRNLHVVTVYIWASDDAPPSGRFELLGYTGTTWRRDGLNFAVISDIPAKDIEAFAARFRQAVE